MLPLQDAPGRLSFRWSLGATSTGTAVDTCFIYVLCSLSEGPEKARPVLKWYKARDILRLLHQDGWYELSRSSGDHIQLKHSSKAGKVTIPDARHDLQPWLVKSILRQAGIDVTEMEGRK